MVPFGRKPKCYRCGRRMDVKELDGPTTRPEQLLDFFVQRPQVTIKRFECPIGCLTFEATALPDLTVLMLGQRGAGKTTYIASLPVAPTLPTWFSLRVDQAPKEDGKSDDRLARWWSKFQPFWNQHAPVNATASLHDQPVLARDQPTHQSGNYGFYPMGVGSDALEPHDPVVLLMDMPGEEFTTDLFGLRNNAPGLPDVPMMILCVDPDARSEGQVAAVLSEIGRLREKPGHLAVVYTKSDLLWDEPGFPTSLKQNPDPGLSPDDYLQQLISDSESVQQYLMKTGRTALIQFAGEYSSASFHMVSATSCAPKPDPSHPDLLRYERVDPVRVVDPFIYYLLAHAPNS